MMEEEESVLILPVLIQLRLSGFLWQMASPKRSLLTGHKTVAFRATKCVM